MARVLGVVERRAPQRHDAVADELVERAAVAENHVYLAREITVEQIDHLGGRLGLRQRGEAADVGEKHRYFARLSRALEAAALDELLHDVRIDEARELRNRLAPRLSLLQVLSERTGGVEAPCRGKRRQHRREE